jgi:hypothetical protein
MDTERLRVLQVSVDLAYTKWSGDPTRLSYLKNLRNTVELLQDATVDEIIGQEARASFDAQEAKTDRETVKKLKEKCRSCGGRGTISESVLHPTNPNWDSWVSRPCHCRNSPPEKNPS